MLLPMLSLANQTITFRQTYCPRTDSPDGCTIHYRTFQWELDGAGDTNFSLYFSLLVLSTASSALFFSSYSYFAHSLSRVLDLLTSQTETDSSGVNSYVMKHTVLLVALNCCVWLSIITLWSSTFLNFQASNFLDKIAQFSLAIAALTTCITFGVHFNRVYLFLRRYLFWQLLIYSSMMSFLVQSFNFFSVIII